MRNIVMAITISAVSLAGCNRGSSNSSINEVATSVNTNSKVDGAMKEIIDQYLQMKNAFADDNGTDAASAGNAFVESMGKMEKNSLPAEKRKALDDISDDAKEMAKHIGKNADRIEHQRGHFDMLCKDMYDLVKTFGAGQTLYEDFCPMYNDKKGATWLSETKEIKNPYMGKKMATCGSVKEEIKQ